MRRGRKGQPCDLDDRSHAAASFVSDAVKGTRILAHHLRDCPDLVEQLPGQVSSRDIFGNLNQCAHWRKKP